MMPSKEKKNGWNRRVGCVHDASCGSMERCKGKHATCMKIVHVHAYANEECADGNRNVT